MKQIIAIGGGGFGRAINDLKIETYIKSQCKFDNPKICFIPTATGDDKQYIDNFYKAFDSLDCHTSHIDFFKRTINLRNHILKQDIIYVGGGNTKSMLAVWQEWELDVILREAYQNNIIMSGVSAGAICWFDQGITDSWKDRQAIIDCMGFVSGVCCPHYDEEPERIPFVKKVLIDKSINECIAIEGYAALHYINDKPKYIVSFGKKKTAHKVLLSENKILHKAFNDINKVKL
ncbi:MAG: peptidase E [Rhodobacteraceae bacterium]|nr:peptidase E [Paracoccaceae bacterium]|tara:strand:- start:718 stop:1416 length:699 start_codon:yes stop_codon:yes gene_type:complete